MEFVWKAISAFGGLAAVTLALVGAAYWLFQTFAERWLQSKFESQIASLKHQQSQEIERLRGRLNALMDRAVKMHDHEYKSLPEIWHALLNAWWEVAGFTSPLQVYADVRAMRSDQLEEHLSQTELSVTQKQAVRTSSDRQKTYTTELYPHRKKIAHDAARGFGRVCRKHSIFLPRELNSALDQFADMLWDALHEHEENEDTDIRPRKRTAINRLRNEGEASVDAIEALIHDRMKTGPELAYSPG